MKKLLLLFVVIMSACTYKTQPATVVEEDSVIENVVDTINSIVSNDSIQ